MGILDQVRHDESKSLIFRVVCISVRNCVKVQVNRNRNQFTVASVARSMKAGGSELKDLSWLLLASCSAVLSMWLSSKKRGEGRAKRIIESALFSSGK